MATATGMHRPTTATRTRRLTLTRRPITATTRRGPITDTTRDLITGTAYGAPTHAGVSPAAARRQRYTLCGDMPWHQSALPHAFGLVVTEGSQRLCSLRASFPSI